MQNYTVVKIHKDKDLHYLYNNGNKSDTGNGRIITEVKRTN